jgi:hypothetical protein
LCDAQRKIAELEAKLAPASEPPTVQTVKETFDKWFDPLLGETKFTAACWAFSRGLGFAITQAQDMKVVVKVLNEGLKSTGYVVGKPAKKEENNGNGTENGTTKGATGRAGEDLERASQDHQEVAGVIPFVKVGNIILFDVPEVYAALDEYKIRAER